MILNSNSNKNREIGLKQVSFFKWSNKSNNLHHIYKSKQFKSVYNLLPDYIHTNFKHLLNKLYLEFKEHEPIINKINIENSRRTLSSTIAKDKITHILKTIFFDSRYIDNSIIKFIDAHINKCYILSYENTINEQTFLFNFIIYDKINIKKLDNCVRTMLLFLQVIIAISNNKKTNAKDKSNICNINGIQITIFMTHFVKHLELNSNKVLGPLNINSGLSYPCLTNGEIYIYRRHEFFKVFIHETLHSYNVDRLYHKNYDSNNYYQALIASFNIDHSSTSYAKIGINEAITEFWTFIIHIFVYCYNNSNNFNNLIKLYERLYKLETIHSSFQIAKILHANNINYAQFLTTITKNSPNLYNETSHVLSYIFFKTLLIYNVEEVLTNHILFKTKIFELNIKMECVDCISNLFNALRKYSLNNHTLTIINSSYVIYNNYYKNYLKARKRTFKKPHLLKAYTKKHTYQKQPINVNNLHNLHNLHNYLLTNLNFMFIDYTI
jgi:hypothetical protein